jgi:hypothetical protein
LFNFRCSPCTNSLRCCGNLDTTSFATEGIGSIGDFWSHVSHTDWCKSHPAVDDGARLPWTIPAAMFADDARIYKEEKMTVYEFSFVLSAATTLQSKFVVAILPNWLIVPEKTCADLERAITWSWRCAFEGVWPTHDHLGREIAKENGYHRFMEMAKIHQHRPATKQTQDFPQAGVYDFPVDF